MVANICPFFASTGVCRYGSACGLMHENPNAASFQQPKRQRVETLTDQACVIPHDLHLGIPFSRLYSLSGGA